MFFFCQYMMLPSSVKKNKTIQIFFFFRKVHLTMHNKQYFNTTDFLTTPKAQLFKINIFTNDVRYKSTQQNTPCTYYTHSKVTFLIQLNLFLPQIVIFFFSSLLFINLILMKTIVFKYLKTYNILAYGHFIFY